MTLLEALSEVKDPRRAEGLRTNLEQIFSMIIISNLCGYFGGRPIARFAQANSETFSKELSLAHGVPSHVTFSGLINRTDGQQLIAAFNKWASHYVELEPKELLSGDGKGLGSTVTDEFNNNQDFKAVVSLFCQQSGLVYALETYRNAKKSEIHVVQFLIDTLKDKGITLFLDAVHCQKKQ